MKPHQNLFAYYENKAAVYGKLQSDYLRDNNQIRWWAIGFNIMLFTGMVATDSKWKFVLLIGSAFCALRFIVLFIDQSNRNFLMHAIDWLEAKDFEPKNTDNL